MSEQRRCVAAPNGVVCGGDVQLVDGSSTRWEHVDRMGKLSGHEAQPQLAHPMDTNPFAGCDL